jgi:hypothetical protein
MARRETQQYSEPFLDMHKQVAVPHVVDIHNNYPETFSGNKLFVVEEHAALIATVRGKNLEDLLVRTKHKSPDEKYEYEREVFVSFVADRRESQARVVQERTKRGAQDFDSRIEVAYGPVETAGTISLLDPTQIRLEYHPRDYWRESGLTRYSSSEGVEPMTGTSLIIRGDELSDAITIRDSDGAEPFTFPLEVKLEQVLLDVKSKLKRQ